MQQSLQKGKIAYDSRSVQPEPGVALVPGAAQGMGRVKAIGFDKAGEDLILIVGP
jgi:hypothetical protein